MQNSRVLNGLLRSSIIIVITFQSEAEKAGIQGQVWYIIYCIGDLNRDGQLEVWEFEGVYDNLNDQAFMQEAAQKCEGSSVSINTI